MIFVSLWMADNLGMFNNANESFASLESQFPIEAEAI
jgi:hypothetical protein